MRLVKGDSASLQQIQDKLKMLQFFNGNCIQFLDAGIQIAIFFQIQRSRCGLPLQVRVIDQHGGEIGQNPRQPISWNFLSKQKHAGGDTLRSNREGQRKVGCTLVAPPLAQDLFG